MKHLFVGSEAQAEGLVICERKIGSRRRDKIKCSNIDNVYWYCNNKEHMKRDCYEWRNRFAIID